MSRSVIKNTKGLRQAIKRFRGKRTLDEFAIFIGVSKRTIQHWEKGDKDIDAQSWELLKAYGLEFEAKKHIVRNVRIGEPDAT